MEKFNIWHQKTSLSVYGKLEIPQNTDLYNDDNVAAWY